jgi:transposase-like protein
VEGSQAGHAGAQGDLLGERRRGRQGALDDLPPARGAKRYPAIAQSWRRNWEHVVPFFAFPEAVRRILYTTNAIETLNSKLRRAVWLPEATCRMTMPR